MKIKKIFLFLLLLLLPVSCSFNTPMELIEAEQKGQYESISYQQLDEKISNLESFVFFIKKSDCSSCSAYYPIVAETLKLDENFKIYALDIKDLESTEQIVLASYFYSCLGKDYYAENEYSQYTLYTPSTATIIKGKFVYAKIGVQTVENLSYFYQPNYLYVNTYYEYNKQVLFKDEVTIIFSKDNDSEYNNSLREYYKSSSKRYVYVDISSFEENDLGRLLNRINYFLGEDNELEILPNDFILEYKNGSIKDFKNGKIEIK